MISSLLTPFRYVEDLFVFSRLHYVFCSTCFSLFICYISISSPLFPPFFILTVLELFLLHSFNFQSYFLSFCYVSFVLKIPFFSFFYSPSTIIVRFSVSLCFLPLFFTSFSCSSFLAFCLTPLLLLPFLVEFGLQHGNPALHQLHLWLQGSHRLYLLPQGNNETTGWVVSINELSHLFIQA